MNLHKQVFVLITLAVLLSLAVGALTPGVVQAEGEVPEMPELVEPSAADEGLPQEAGVTDAVQVLAESGSILVQDGSAVPLASQAALHILCEPDPWFYGACTGGKCTGYATIQDALNAWVGNAGKGFIYLEGGYNPPITQNLTISGLIYPTLKGIVWDTKTAGSKPILVGYLDVNDFSSGFTLQGLDIRYHGSGEPMRLFENTGLFRMIDVDITTTNPTSAGFKIFNNGPVELLRVNAGGAGVEGVVIDTCSLSGSACTTSGSVKITNSSFNNTQKKYGLAIKAKGTVNISGTSVSYNNGSGLQISATGTVVIKNSVFSGNQTAEPSAGYGLYVIPGTTGSVTLDNVVLTNNSNHGAFISTTGNVTLKNVTASLNKKGIMIAASISGGSGAGALNVSILNGVFHDNKDVSLWVEAKGSISLTNFLSSSPDTYGLQLDNTYAVAAPGVTIKNASLLNNGVGGGVVKSKGSILIDSINVPSSPLSYGLDLNNITGVGGVTLKSSLFQNFFAGAKFAGLRINTTRNVVLNNVLAVYNGEAGVEVRAGPNAGSVSLKNVSANNNGGWGVWVRTDGAINWIGGGASMNGQNIAFSAGGVSLANEGALETAPKSITLSGLVLNDNQENVGIEIYTRGSVTLTSITADRNFWDGIKAYKYPGVGSIKASLIHTVGNDIIGLNIYQIPGDSRSVNVSLKNITANQNGSWGVYVEMNGTISWVKGEATDNGNSVSFIGGGAVIINVAAFENASKSVTLKDVVIKNNLRNNGLFIKTRGAVTISNVQISGHTNNTGLHLEKYSGVGNITLTNVTSESNKYGIDITTFTITPRFNNVTLNNVYANNNNGFGIAIGANGNITWNKGGASDNYNISAVTGVWLSNYDYSLPAIPYGIKLSNVTLRNPGSYGMFVNSYGAVTLSGVTATDHLYYNAMINTCGGSSSVSCTNTYLAPVTVLKSTFTGAYGSTGYDSLQIRASGAVTLSGVQVSNNTGKGVYINNRIGTLLAKPVTVINSTFNKNSTGAIIESDGVILLNSITASMNRNYEGLYAFNNTALVPRAITITGMNNFNANKDTGLKVISNGQITVSGVRASTNEYMGIYLYSYQSGVKLSNSLVEGNRYTGVYIGSQANVLVNSLNSFYNGWWAGDNGITIEAYVLSGTPPFVTISNSNFLGNFNYGISLYVNAPKEAHYKFINVAAFGNMLDDILVSD